MVGRGQRPEVEQCALWRALIGGLAVGRGRGLAISFPAILILACASSSPAFLMMYSAYKLNKQMTIYSLDVLLFLFGTSLLCHV